MIIESIDGYKPRAESIAFFSFCNMMFGADDNETPLMHYYLVDEILTGHGKFIGEMFRGSAKTTNLSHKMPLYVAAMGKLPNFGNVKNAVLISDTFEQADTVKRDSQSLGEAIGRGKPKGGVTPPFYKKLESNLNSIHYHFEHFFKDKKIAI
jgi:hypothetical protein